MTVEIQERQVPADQRLQLCLAGRFFDLHARQPGHDFLAEAADVLPERLLIDLVTGLGHHDTGPGDRADGEHRPLGAAELLDVVAQAQEAERAQQVAMMRDVARTRTLSQLPLTSGLLPSHSLTSGQTGTD